MITVGVPTFERSDVILPLARQLSAAVAAGRIEAIIIDDGSCDGTASALAELPHRAGFKIESQSTNLGYASTFLRLFDECRTEYLLVTADDDHIDFDQLDALEAWLSDRQPDIVSTQWRKRDGRLYRGRKRTEPLNPRDFRRFSNHAPGLVYRVDACASALSTLKELVVERSDVALVYPQVVITAVLLASGGSGMWWGGTIIREGDGLESGILDSSGDRYWDPSSRFRQHLALSALLSTLESEAGELMLSQHRKSFYPVVRAQLDALAPGSAASLDASARRILARAFAKRLLRRS